MDHFPVTLKDTSRGFGLLSKTPPSTAVIFLHGFGGHPRYTWVDFAGIIEESAYRSVWRGCDLYFYGYKSYDQFPILANTFSNFLGNIATRREKGVIDESCTFPSSENYILGLPAVLTGSRGVGLYKELVLVGHSTGAVIIRECIRVAVTTIKKQNPDFNAWCARPKVDLGDEANFLLAKSQLRFFAPAHLGVLSAGVLGLAQNLPYLEKIVGGFLSSNPLYQTLKPGSPLIRDLQQETEAMYKTYPVPALKAQSTFGEHEEIVFVGKYSHDDPTVVQPGHKHTSICKPNSAYLAPIVFALPTPRAQYA